MTASTELLSGGLFYKILLGLSNQGIAVPLQLNNKIKANIIPVFLPATLNDRKH